MFTTSITMTSKNQVTIPAAIVREWGSHKGNKIVARYNSENKTLELVPVEKLVEKVQNTLKVPDHLKHISVDDALRMVRDEMYKNSDLI